ncbi:MAG: GAF domain-containing protein [Acidobacteriota bacterium]
MILNRNEKTIEVKLVFYGPALSGKTTNLVVLHSMLPPETRVPLTSLKTEGDRTLFFDFLPLSLEVLNGWTIRMKTYTVPGQVRYASTRRLILSGCDGLVFVADSAATAEEANRVALQDMRANLRANQIDSKTIPLVLQYNKRDLPDALSLAAMDGDLNREGLPRLEAVASSGEGVRETFVALASRATASAIERLKMNRIAPARLEQELESMLPMAPNVSSLGRPRRAPGRSVNPSYDLTDAAVDRDPEAGESALLQQAVAGAVSMASDLADANESTRLLEAHRQQFRLLAELATAKVSSRPEQLRSLIQEVGKAAGLSAGLVSARMPWSERSLDPLALNGIEKDPLSEVEIPGLGSLAFQLLQAGRPLLTTDIRGQLLHGNDHPAIRKLEALISVPLVDDGQGFALLCLMNIKTDRPGPKPGEDQLRFAQVAAALLTPHAKAVRASIRQPAGTSWSA